MCHCDKEVVVDAGDKGLSLHYHHKKASVLLATSMFQFMLTTAFPFVMVMKGCFHVPR